MRPARNSTRGRESRGGWTSTSHHLQLNLAQCPTNCIFLAAQSSAIPKLTLSHLSPAIWVILTIIMEKRAPNMPPEMGPEDQPQGRADLLLPNLNNANFSYSAL